MGLRRNAFEHDYPDPASREASLRQAFDTLSAIQSTMVRCRDWLESRFGLALPLLLDNGLLFSTKSFTPSYTKPLDPPHDG